jgi:hypothetical protein
MNRLTLVQRKHTNGLQFLVGVVRLFLAAEAFYVAQSRFLRNAKQLRFRHAKNERCPRLGDILRYLVAHSLLQFAKAAFLNRPEPSAYPRPICIDLFTMKVWAASVSELFSVGVGGGDPAHGGGPLSCLQHSGLPNPFNPVNHPI